MGFLRRAFPYAALALGALLLTVAVRETWQFVSHNIDQSRSEALTAALTAADPVPALAKLSKDDSGPRAAMAGLIAFQRMDLAAQKTDGVKLLQAMQADASLPKEWRDLATITQVRARIAFGEGDAEKLLADLKPVTTDNDSPWFATALLQQALIQGEMQNDKKAAYQTLEAVPQGALSSELAKQAALLRGRYAQPAPDKKS